MGGPGRRALLAVLVAVFLSGTPAPLPAQSGRAEVPASRQIYAKMLEGLSNRDFGEVERSIPHLKPLLQPLSRKYGKNLEELLRRSISANDRQLGQDAIILVILFDTHDLVDSSVRRGGQWEEAKANIHHAVLNYQLATDLLQKKEFSLDGNIKQNLRKLDLLLANADPTTNPTKIEEIRTALLSHLVQMRRPFDEREALAVIVSLENPVDRISSEELRAIYLKEKVTWGDGSPIRPIDLEEADPARQIFTQKILNRTVEDLKLYWVKRIFSAQGTPPLSLQGDQQVKESVVSHKGAIGYIRWRNLDGAVKAVLIDGARSIP